MRYLITGGAGFIGSHLAEALLQKGGTVQIIDNLSTGSFLNIEHLRSQARFRYVLDDVRNRQLLAEVVDMADVVFHLAAAVGVRLIVESPVDTIETNVHATELVLEAAAKKKKKVILASTSEVYGKASKVPFSENDDLLIGPPHKGRWSYACSKLIDEFLGLAYWREKRTPVIVARLFNTIGPRQTGQYGMVVPRFIRQAITGEPITVYGDGRQSRCFGWIGDVVRALIALSEHTDAVGNVYNIGSQDEITILELAKKVAQVTHSSSSIVFVPYDQAYQEGFEDMPQRVPDLTRIKRLIGYRPSMDLDSMLRAIAKWIQGELAERGKQAKPLVV